MTSRKTAKILRDSYAWVAIHQMMIADKKRTMSYMKAIKNSVKSNDIVLDAGCGMGILSFFAAITGCKKIYAIEKSEILNAAIAIAKRNNLDKHIDFIRGDLFDFNAKEKIDILIHDQIGDYIWDESLIRKISYIRDNFLKTGGRIIPFKVSLYLVPVDYKTNLEKSISFWSRKRYGLDFKDVIERVLTQEADSFDNPTKIRLNGTRAFLSKPSLACVVDLRKDSSIPTEITSCFKLKKNSTLTGVCGYFNVHLDGKYSFSTIPAKTNTHWGQFFIPCPGKMKVGKNRYLQFTLWPKRKPRDWKFKFELLIQNSTG